MTAPDPLQVLLDRACRRLAPAEAAALRAGITRLRQELAAAEAATAEMARTDRYRAAWKSARRRSRVNADRAAAATPTTIWSGQHPFTAIDLRATQ